MNVNDDVMEIDLQEVLGLLLYKIWLIAICAVVGALGAFVISKFFITPLYESTTSVYILNKSGNSTVALSDVQLGTQLTKDYAQMITSRDVLEGVIEVFYLDESYKDFKERVAVVTPSDTRMINISVTDEDPFMAQQLANEVRKLAAEKIKEVMDIEAVNTVDEANLPEDKSSPSVFRWTAVGGMLGIFLCVAVLIIRFLLDDTIKTSEDVEKYLQLSTLASIPVKEDESKAKKHHRRYSGDLEETTGAEEEGDETDIHEDREQMANKLAEDKGTERATKEVAEKAMAEKAGKESK